MSSLLPFRSHRRVTRLLATRLSVDKNSCQEISCERFEDRSRCGPADRPPTPKSPHGGLGTRAAKLVLPFHTRIAARRGPRARGDSGVAWVSDPVPAPSDHHVNIGPRTLDMRPQGWDKRGQWLTAVNRAPRPLGPAISAGPGGFLFWRPGAEPRRDGLSGRQHQQRVLRLAPITRNTRTTLRPFPCLLPARRLISRACWVRTSWRQSRPPTRSSFTWWAIPAPPSSSAITKEATVADAMAAEISGAVADVPAFFFHLGDVIYKLRRGRVLLRPVLRAVPRLRPADLRDPGQPRRRRYLHEGRHRARRSPRCRRSLPTFCTPTPQKPQDGGGLARTTMTQPGVYFTLDAPFVSIIGLYTNVLEGSRCDHR